MAAASTDDIYAAMDWLVSRQDAIEAELARRHLGPPQPGFRGFRWPGEAPGLKSRTHSAAAPTEAIFSLGTNILC